MTDAAKREVLRLAEPLRKGALGIEIYAVLVGVGGVAAGIAIALHTETVVRTSAFRPTRSHATRPWVAAGIGVVAGAVLLGLVVWCVGRALELYATDTALRHGNGVRVRAPKSVPAPTNPVSTHAL